jgi:hypothetical protein
MQTNRALVIGKAETVNGTRIDPLATDNNVDMFGIGQPTIDDGKQVSGQRADGSFREGDVHGNQQSITMPDFSAFFTGSGTATVEPKLWKLLKASGWRVGDGAASAKKLYWNGVPDCDTLSMDWYSWACATKATKYKGRGMVGSSTIGFEGSNASFIANFTGFTGAYVGKEDATIAEGSIPVTGADTAPQEKAGNYSLSMGGGVYVVETFSAATGNGIGMVPANNGQGIATARISTQAGRVNLKLVQLVEADTTIADYLAGTKFATITLTGGGTAKFNITITSAQILSCSFDDADGTSAWSIELVPQAIEFLQK